MKKMVVFLFVFCVNILNAHPWYTFVAQAIKSKQEKIACTLIGQSLKGIAKSSETTVWKLIKEAIVYDCPQVVEVLLRFISVEKILSQDQYGKTLLDYAQEFNRSEIVEMLNKKIAEMDKEINSY